MWLPNPHSGGSKSVAKRSSLLLVAAVVTWGCSVVVAVGTDRLLCSGQHTNGVVPTYPHTDLLKNVRVSGLLLCVLNNCTKGSQLLMLIQLPENCSGVWHEEPSKI